jgi:hypothetical protein
MEKIGRKCEEEQGRDKIEKWRLSNRDRKRENEKESMK